MNNTETNPTSIINTNSIAFIGLCNEYCQTLSTAAEHTPDEFIHTMLRLLPRIYIAATDITVNFIEDSEPYIEPFLDEESYEEIRRNIQTILGADDTFLEVFEENMKYSDTPIAASVSESLADIFQVLFNFISTVRDATDSVIAIALLAVQEDFRNYWSAKLCNVLRALNNIAYNRLED